MAKNVQKTTKGAQKKAVVFQQSLDSDVYKRACVYLKENGLGSVQNVVRIAISSMLKNQGY